jgi:hypothetical protein
MEPSFKRIKGPVALIPVNSCTFAGTQWPVVITLPVLSGLLEVPGCWSEHKAVSAQILRLSDVIAIGFLMKTVS